MKIGNFEEEIFTEIIPFKYVEGLIIIVVEIDNQPYNFVLDTGAEIGAVSPKLLSKISYKKQSTIKVTDSNSDSKRPITITINSLKIGNTNFKDMWTISQDFSAIQDYFSCDLDIHGFIGSNLMRKANWKIDYQKKQIEFRNLKNKFKTVNVNYTIPLECDDFGSVYITLEIDNKFYKFTYDSGFNGFIGSYVKELSKIRSSNNYAESYNYTIGLYEAQQSTEIRKIAYTIKMGELIINNNIVSYEDVGSSLIGNKFWEQFNVIVDWENCQLHLEKIKDFNNDSLVAFQYGFRIDSKKNNIFIGSQWKTHSLYKPLKSNTKVLSIDEFVISEVKDFCNFKNSDYQLLLGRDSLSIVILEDDIRKNIKLKKEHLILK